MMIISQSLKINMIMITGSNNFNHIAKKKKEVYHYEGGIKEYVEFQNKNKTPIHPSVIYYESVRKDKEVEIAMQWTDAYTENIFSYDTQRAGPLH